MWTKRAIVTGLALLFINTPGRCDDTPVNGKIVAVDLFKNGLAVVRCEVTLGKPGSYVLDQVPQPVHGTYWIESAGPVESVARMQDVEVPAGETAPGNLQEDLAGKKVTLHLKGANRQPVIGTMMKLKPVKPEEIAAGSRYLVVQTGKGRVYVEASEVASVEAEDAGDKLMRRQPRLFLKVPEGAKDETKVTVRYLTHGLSWVMDDARRKHQFDLYYVKNNSLILDLLVLIETVSVIVFREGQ